MHDIARINFFR